jgi:low affinity Fe/Cu permease
MSKSFPVPTKLDRESSFQKLADKVSFFMGTPLNIGIWVVLVVVWVLIFALKLVNAQGTFLPAWFTSTGFNFPLNLVTTVAELYIGFLVGASSNRSERHLENTLDGLGQVENNITALITENNDLTKEVADLTRKIAQQTALLDEIHRHVAALTPDAGQVPPATP